MNTQTVGHTPGEWYVGKHEDNGEIVVRVDENIIANCEVDFYEGYKKVNKKEECEANARLIAAAPDLLEALKKANKIMHELCDNYCRDEEGYLKEDAKGWSAEDDIFIQTAINKATKQ